VKLFFIRILVLNHAISIVQRSLKLVIELDFKLLYHTRTDPLKIMGKILHMV